MATRRTATASAATQVERQLERYRSMRDFSVTAEPRGKARGAKAAQGLPFVIQKHAASHLHYDFRLGWNGVLKSWAVAKGPSYVTADKRLAVQVEDHPIEYGGFEGIIPKGQYGGGTVMLWDHGTWEPQPGHEDVDDGLRLGSLKFVLHGEKLKGKWALIRMGGRAANESKPNWLLIKEHDDFERSPGDEPVTEAEPDSAVTGRTMDQIAKSEDHVWHSKETAKAKPKLPWKKAPSPPRSAPEEKLPAFVPPQLAAASSTPVRGDGWIHELKLDGYRIQARKQDDDVRLLTRTGLDWTHRMPAIADAVRSLPCRQALLDGEVVVLAENGATSFADLQAAFEKRAKKPLTYFAFDLLHLDGRNLRGLPLLERKSLLERLLDKDGDIVRYSDHVEASGKLVFEKACSIHAEGIVSKRASGRYISGRTGDWYKLKCVREQEFVIGGFTLPSNGSHGVGALLLGYYEGRRLIYAGRTGTGFTQKLHRMLRDRLEKLRQSSTPFAEVPSEARHGAYWVKPQLVAQIHFATWTSDNLLRQASFKGLREDKPASEVRREEPAIAAAKHAAPAGVAAKAAPARSGSVSIRLTHPDKILDPTSQLTKLQLYEYYSAIAPHMLPHIAGRPISLVRCPDGAAKPCFFQKHANRMLPDSIQSIDVPDKKTGKPEPYITVSTPEALASLAQAGVLEIHPWGSRNDDLEHPDRIVFDLDPDEAIPWSTLAASASEVRQRLKKLGLESFLKSTGGKGLHVVVPIQPQYDWAAIKQFAHQFVLELERQQPSLYLSKMTRAARKGRIYLDYLRNERGATSVAPFSPRARPGIAVSMPMSWTELKLSERPVFAVTGFSEWRTRLSRDPWKKLPATRQHLTLQMLAAFRISPSS